MSHSLVLEVGGHQGPGEAGVPAAMYAKHHGAAAASSVHAEGAPASPAHHSQGGHSNTWVCVLLPVTTLSIL